MAYPLEQEYGDGAKESCQDVLPLVLSTMTGPEIECLVALVIGWCLLSLIANVSRVLL